MPQPYVHIELDKPRKLRFGHRDLKDCTERSGKQISELISDPFSGWAWLLCFGLRHNDRSMTPDKASDLIDVWCQKNDFDALGVKLTEAIEASGFIKFKRSDDSEPEGKAQASTGTEPETASS